MKNFTRAFSSVLPIMLVLIAGHLNAQIFYNNGGLVHINPGGLVQINGGFQDDNSGDVINDGDMWVTSKGSWPGDIQITNLATLEGNGKHHLDQDWINNATFNDDNSTVDMYGNDSALITSTNGTVTTFDTLLLRGAGVGINRRKIQTLNAIVDHALLLNDRILYTGVNTMFIITPTVTAVTNTNVYKSEGFVMSTPGGSLSRVTNSANAYFYPVGADSVVTRYRKILLTPAASGADAYTVRLANHDASNDGDSIGLLDTTLCKVNPFFYHVINRTVGVDNASIDAFYDPSMDGIWTKLAQWNTPTVNEWNNMGAVTYTVGGNYNDVLKSNWGNFSNQAYILGDDKPVAPTLSCNPYCANSSGVFTAVGDSGSYIWSVPAGDTIVSGNGTGSVTVTGNVTGPITVFNKLTGCSSASAACSITIIPAPNAGFDTLSTGLYNNTYDFTDTSKPNVVSWYWNFGDGDSANIADPGHIYQAGTYTVVETVTNSNGCSSTRTEVITIPEGIYVPNVFTPNGDGQDDMFTISASGVKNFHIEIFNRWGEKVFESDSPQISWDGRTSAGVMASDGTYFYILQATSLKNENWNKNGYLQLIR